MKSDSLSNIVENTKTQICTFNAHYVRNWIIRTFPTAAATAPATSSNEMSPPSMWKIKIKIKMESMEKQSKIVFAIIIALMAFFYQDKMSRLRHMHSTGNISMEYWWRLNSTPHIICSISSITDSILFDFTQSFLHHTQLVGCGKQKQKQRMGKNQMRFFSTLKLTKQVTQCDFLLSKAISKWKKKKKKKTKSHAPALGMLYMVWEHEVAVECVGTPIHF